jgi:hypothetical protein
MNTERIKPLGFARVFGATSLLAVGGIHFEQYSAGHFSVIPTIGELFLVNFLAATLLGIWLLVPLRGRYRLGLLACDLAAALAGVGVAAGGLVALLVSEQTPLFGFMEQGYRIEIVIALASEAATILLLGAFAILAGARARRLYGVARRPAVAP